MHYFVATDIIDYWYESFGHSTTVTVDGERDMWSRLRMGLAEWGLGMGRVLNSLQQRANQDDALTNDELMQWSWHLRLVSSR